MFFSSLVIQEHLISLEEIIHSVNDLGMSLYNIYIKTTHIVSRFRVVELELQSAKAQAFLI